MTAEVAGSSRRTKPRDKVPSRGSKPGERRGGRAKGTPNRVTTDLRQVIRDLLDNAAPKMAGWLDEVAKDNPGKALELALRAAEYTVPKLSRAEVSHGLTLEELVTGVGQHFGGDEIDEDGLRETLRRALPPAYIITGVPDPDPLKRVPAPEHPMRAEPVNEVPVPEPPPAGPETYVDLMRRLNANAPARVTPATPLPQPSRVDDDGVYNPIWRD